MANITVQLKRLGKKKVIALPYIITRPASLEELIASCVRAEIAAFNERRTEIRLLSFLSPAQMDEQSTSGKIGFGDLANRDLADLATGIETARQAYLDGLFTVFIDDDEVTDLTTPLEVNDDSTITFLRLTFLTGTFW